ncbi:MAG TPA: pyrroline-5-carboxylate reductase [Streptosporangiaceae bacterium]
MSIPVQGHAGRVAIIGIGQLGEAVLAGLLGAGLPASALTGTVLPVRRARALSARYSITVTTDNAAAAADADIVLLVVPPGSTAGTAAEIAGALHADAVVVSLAAGVTTAMVERRLAPSAAVIRAVVNTPIQVGQGMTALCPGAAVLPDQLARVRWLFTRVGVTVEIPESLAETMTAIAGSGPALVYHQAAAMVSAAVAQGLDGATAATAVAQTCYGAASMLKNTTSSPSALIDQVATPGGSTSAALDELDKADVAGSVGRAVVAAVRRSQTLATTAPAGP